MGKDKGLKGGGGGYIRSWSQASLGASSLSIGKVNLTSLRLSFFIYKMRIIVRIQQAASEVSGT